VTSVLEKNEKMKNMMAALMACALSILLFPLSPMANPIVEHVSHHPDYAQFLAIPAILVMEGVILAILAKESRPYFFRFVSTWTLLTTITFILLMIVIELAGGAAIACILGEITVTVTEGVALYYLLRFQKLTREPESAPSFVRSLLYSLIANAFSFIGGDLIADLPGKMHVLTNSLR